MSLAQDRRQYLLRNRTLTATGLVESGIYKLKLYSVGLPRNPDAPAFPKPLIEVPDTRTVLEILGADSVPVHTGRGFVVASPSVNDHCARFFGVYVWKRDDDGDPINVYENHLFGRSATDGGILRYPPSNDTVCTTEARFMGHEATAWDHHLTGTYSDEDWQRAFADDPFVYDHPDKTQNKPTRPEPPCH